MARWCRRTGCSGEPSGVRLLRYLAIVFVLAIVMTVVGVVSRPLHIRQDFYAVVAQVLPVFLLVVAVQGRLFVTRPHHGVLRRTLTEQLLVVALLGEIFALAAVARGSASTTLRGGVLTALAIVGLMFGPVALDGPREPHEHRR